MEFHYTQIFLFVWLISFWIHHFFTYGKVEGKFERSISKDYGIKSKWEVFFGIAFIGFTVNILLYFFIIQAAIGYGRGHIRISFKSISLQLH